MTLTAALWLTPMVAAGANRYWVYVGTYTGPQSKGIYAFHFDADSGKIRNLTLGEEYTAEVIPPFMQELIAAGGLIEWTKKKIH